MPDAARESDAKSKATRYVRVFDVQPSTVLNTILTATVVLVAVACSTGAEGITPDLWDYIIPNARNVVIRNVDNGAPGYNFPPPVDAINSNFDESGILAYTDSVVLYKGRVNLKRVRDTLDGPDHKYLGDEYRGFAVWQILVESTFGGEPFLIAIPESGGYFLYGDLFSVDATLRRFEYYRDLPSSDRHVEFKHLLDKTGQDWESLEFSTGCPLMVTYAEIPGNRCLASVEAISGDTTSIVILFSSEQIAELESDDIYAVYQEVYGDAPPRRGLRLFHGREGMIDDMRLDDEFVVVELSGVSR